MHEHRYPRTRLSKRPIRNNHDAQTLTARTVAVRAVTP